MSQPQSARKIVLLHATSTLLVLAAILVTFASTARAAEQYGELTRFGTTGDAEGQLDEERTRAIGVDPSDNSVYVVDEPEEQTQKKEKIKVKPTPEEVEECEEEGKSKVECEAETEEEVAVGPITRHLRLQQFKESTPGTYTVSASARFTDASEEFEEGRLVQLGIEGIAVDPTRERVYLLAADARNDSLKHDSSQAKGSGTTTLLTASTLYAFSTVASGKELVGAGTEGPNKEVLSGPGVLKAQADKKPGESLLDPSGITVDPSTGEVIILGHIDEAGNAEDKIGDTTDHYALQRVTSSGVLGDRYVDGNSILKKSREGEAPSSPTVANASGAEHVYVLHEGLVEIPYNFKETTEPKVVFENPPVSSVELGLSVATIPGGSSTSFGGALSASPPEGNPAVSTIYGHAGVKNEAEPGAFALSGVLALAPSGAEIGWTGGQRVVEPADKDNCVLEPDLATLPVQVAAGSGGKVFALAPEFLLRKEPSKVLPGPFFPAVVEFGPQPPAPPGSVGCPEASATAPVAEVKGKVVPEATSVAVGTEVSFSSTVKQSDALKVEWEFGDGTPKDTVTPKPGEFQTTAVAHTFTKASPAEGFLVKETIHTDDLATPEVTVERRIHVGEPPPPEAVLEGPSGAKVNETVTFKDPSPAGVKTYEWVFGDGTKEPTEVPSAKHVFTKPGEYKVSLTVANAAGTKSAPVSIMVTVTEEHKEEQHKEEHKEEQHKEEQKPPPTEEKHEVQKVVEEHNPEAKLASATLAVNPSGTVVVDVTCPAGESTCTGTVTLRTLSAVVAGVGAGRAHVSKSKAAILTLASGSFTVGGGQGRTVTLHLTSKARKLLTRSKMLRAKATIVAHDPSGATKTTQTTVTLRVSKAKRKH